MDDDIGDDERRHVRDLVAAYVLGAVTPLERALVESHLATCGSCRQMAAELRGVGALLPALAGELAPPTALKTRLMGIVEAEARRASAPYSLYAPDVPEEAPAEDAPAMPEAPPAEDASRSPTSGHLPPDGWPWRRQVAGVGDTSHPTRRPSIGRVAALVALAAAVALVALGVGLWRLTGSAPPRPSTAVSIAGTTLQPAVQGSLRYYKDGGRVDLDVHGLKFVPSGQVYELWLIRGHYRLTKSLGTFRPTRDGTAHLTAGSDDVSGYTLACLTVERAPGALQPTLPLIAAGDILG